MTEMVLPQFGMGMSDGTITAWHKAVGDAVVQGEPLCEVEAAKTTVEVGAPCDGFLHEILVPSGTNVPVNSVIAIIGDSAEVPPPKGAAVAPKPEPEPELESKPRVEPAEADNLPKVSLRPIPAPKGPSLPASPAPAAVRAPSSNGTRPGHGPQVEPRARRAARLHNVDLKRIQGSGPGGRIVEEDVVRSLQSPPASAPAAVVSGGVAATASSGGVTHQLRLRCDAGPLSSLLGELEELHGKPMAVEAVFARAAALALAKAGRAGSSIGIRADDGTTKVLDNPASFGLFALADRLAEMVEASTQAPALVIDVCDEDWLEEVVLIGAGGPASLSFGKNVRTGDQAGEEWQVTFSGNPQDTSIGEAKLLLKAMRSLLENPVGILV